MNAPRIHLFGAAHIDRAGRSHAPVRLARSNPGRFANTPGGAAFNVASILAALGVDVRLYSILGDDADAQVLRKAAKARKISLSVQISSEHGTATYTSIMGPDGDLVAAIADMAIYDQFRAAAPSTLDALRDHDWILVDANLPPTEIAEIIRRAPGPVAAMSVSAAKAARLRPSLPGVDILFTNQAELTALCEAASEEAMARLLDRFGQLGGNDLVVSDGSADVWLRRHGAVRRYSVPACDAIVDVTGAGDALTAGCLSAILAQRPITEAVPFGIKVAQAILGAQGSWRPDLSSILSPPWEA